MSILTGSEKFIEVATGNYPLSFSEIARKLPNVLFGANVDVEELAALGFREVIAEDHAEGDVATEVTPVEIDGVYKQQWEVRSFTEEELDTKLNVRKAELREQVAALSDSALVSGVPYDFGGAYGIKSIQLRDGDRANLGGMRQIAKDHPEIPQRFRTFENVIVPLDADGVLSMTLAALYAYNGILDKAWQLKDAIETATTEAELPELPFTLIEG